jgi:MFS family permease
MRSLLVEPSFRAFLAASLLARLAESALAVLLGITVYQTTHTVLALGWLGLAEAAPMIGLVLIGGHVADRCNRRFVTVLARTGLGALAFGVGVVAWRDGGVAAIYTIAFAIGCVRAFEDPATAGLEAQVVPIAHAVRAASVLGSLGRAASLGGPVAGGLLYDLAGPAATYATLGGMLALSALVLRLGIPARAPAAPAGPRPRIAANIVEGLRYVFSNQIIVGSMALDLFAVFFGGVTGLLPVFATDILGVGPAGVGLLRAAASAGALAAMVIATRHPPRARAGLMLHAAIAGFGVSIIVFGLSTTFWLSMAALFAAGACDGISMVVRHAVIRVVAPDAMRGRISAVRSVFVNSSNELGDFESGIAASLVGAAAAVWLGGIATLLVVAVTAWCAPALRRLDLQAMIDTADRDRR